MYLDHNGPHPTGTDGAQWQRARLERLEVQPVRDRIYITIDCVARRVKVDIQTRVSAPGTSRNSMSRLSSLDNGAA